MKLRATRCPSKWNEIAAWSVERSDGSEPLYFLVMHRIIPKPVPTFGSDASWSIGLFQNLCPLLGPMLLGASDHPKTGAHFWVRCFRIVLLTRNQSCDALDWRSATTPAPGRYAPVASFGPAPCARRARSSRGHNPMFDLGQAPMTAGAGQWKFWKGTAT